MSFYFVCPGEASVTSTSVQCSQVIATLDANAYEPLVSLEDRQVIIDGLMGCLVTLAICWLIKKAIDL